MRYTLTFHLDNEKVCQCIHECDSQADLVDYLISIQSPEHTFVLIDDEGKPFLINMLRVNAVITNKVDESCVLKDSSMPLTCA